MPGGGALDRVEAVELPFLRLQSGGAVVDRLQVTSTTGSCAGGQQGLALGAQVPVQLAARLPAVCGSCRYGLILFSQRGPVQSLSIF